MLPVISSFSATFFAKNSTALHNSLPSELSFFWRHFTTRFHLWYACQKVLLLGWLLINYFLEEITNNATFLFFVEYIRSLFYQVSNNFIRPLLSYAAEFSANRQQWPNVLTLSILRRPNMIMCWSQIERFTKLLAEQRVSPKSNFPLK